MIGYHYTSASNWEKIQKEGLKPYPITNPEVNEPMGRQIYGIWVWQQNPEGENERGIVLDKMIKKKETAIVKLFVEYDNNRDTVHRSRKYPTGVKLEPMHKGSLGDDYVYHENYPAHILNKAIPTM